MVQIITVTLNKRLTPFAIQDILLLTVWSIIPIIQIVNRVVNNRKENAVKKAEKTEITREKIMKASIEEFGTNGFNGTSVNQICKKHGISKGLIYHNFESKEKLYVCCVDTAVNAFISYMEKQDFGLDFNLYMKERYKFFEKNPYYCKLIFGIILTDGNGFSNEVKEIKKRFDSFNHNIYIRAVDRLLLRNGISRDDAIQYYGLLHNMLNSYFSANISSDGYLDNAISNHEKILEKMLDYMLYGIAKEEK